MSWIDEVKARASLLEIAGRYTALRQAGATWRGPCPIHGGKGPNFAVYPERGTFHCFTCKATGDLFHLLEKLEGLDFRAAARRLADELGIPVTARPGVRVVTDGDAERRQELQRLFREGHEWWEGHVGEHAARAWGLGARRAGETVVGTVPLFQVGSRRLVGWMCYDLVPDGGLVALGLAPESALEAAEAVAVPADLEGGVERQHGVLACFPDPLEAIVCWEAGGRGVVGCVRRDHLAQPLPSAWLRWWQGAGVEAVWWGWPTVETETQRALFQQEVPLVAHGMANLLPAPHVGALGGLDRSALMGQALEAWDTALDDATPPAVDSFEARLRWLRQARPRGPLPMAWLRDKLGATIRAASRLSDRRLFYAYTRWAFRAAGGGDFSRFLGELTREPTPTGHGGLEG